MPRKNPSQKSITLKGAVGEDTEIRYNDATDNKVRMFWDESAETLKIRTIDSTSQIWLEQGNTGNGIRIDFDGLTHIYAGGTQTLEIDTNYIELSNNGATINWGSGTPESAVTAPIGSTFHRTDGGASTSFYVKESGSGNTGWRAV